MQTMRNEIALQIHTSDISLSQYTYNLLPFSPHKKLDTELKMNTISERI